MIKEAQKKNKDAEAAQAKRILEAKKQAEAALGTAKRMAKKTGQTSVLVHAIFDHPATDLQRVATYPAGSVPIEASAATPVIITSCKWLETLSNDSAVMQSELQSFLSAFEGSPPAFSRSGADEDQRPGAQ